MKKGDYAMPEVKHEIKKHFGFLSENKRGWKKEVNLVSWNDREAKYDIREWSEDHEKLGRGITFNAEEIVKLKAILDAIDLNELS